MSQCVQEPRQLQPSPTSVCPWTAPTLTKVRGTPENTQKGLKSRVTPVSFQAPVLSTLGHTSPRLTFKKPDTGGPWHTFQSSHTRHHSCRDNSLASRPHHWLACSFSFLASADSLWGERGLQQKQNPHLAACLDVHVTPKRHH